MNESFAESFGEINTDGGDNPHTHTHISVGQESTGGHGRGECVILNANGIVIGERVSIGGSKGARRGDIGERE
jgi:predicted DNA-binding protein with PD1-like motif